MGITSPMADCLSAPDEIFTAYFDPIVEAMMMSVTPIIEPLCIALWNKPDIKIAFEIIAEFGLKLPDIALDPLILFELAGIELPSILLGFDISMEIAIDIDLPTLPAYNIAIGMLLIPIDIVIGWIDSFPVIELPTIDLIIDLLIDLGFDPSINLECVAQIIMIPFEVIGEVMAATDKPSICE